MRIHAIYLKILDSFWLLSVIWLDFAAGKIISAATTNSIYKKILKMRTLPFEDCGSKYDVLFVKISSCNAIPCKMQRDTMVVVKVIFDDNGNDARFLKHRVRWIFNAVKTDVAITPDPCDGDHECLVNENNGKSYYAQVYVNSVLPTIRGSMLWEVSDAKNEEVICFKIPVVITA